MLNFAEFALTWIPSFMRAVTVTMLAMQNAHAIFVEKYLNDKNQLLTTVVFYMNYVSRISYNPLIQLHIIFVY